MTDDILLQPWSVADQPYDSTGVNGWNFHDMVVLCLGIDTSKAADALFACDCCRQQLSAWQVINAWHAELARRVDAEREQVDTDLLILENAELRELASELRAEVSRLTIQILRANT